MEAYQELFYTVQRNTSDRRDEGPPPDAEWAKKFLKQLNICHARYGVFLSQDIYTRLWTFRGALRTVAKKVETNQPISEADLVSLDYLWSNNLAANLKNEMLGYEPLTFDRFKSIATAKP